MLQKPVDSLEATKPKQRLLMPFDGTWKCMIKLGKKGVLGEKREILYALMISCENEFM